MYLTKLRDNMYLCNIKVTNISKFRVYSAKFVKNQQSFATLHVLLSACPDFITFESKANFTLLLTTED